MRYDGGMKLNQPTEDELEAYLKHYIETKIVEPYKWYDFSCSFKSVNGGIRIQNIVIYEAKEKPVILPNITLDDKP
jgi:hypothetical protein